MSSAIDLQIERLSFTHIEIPRTPIRRTIADTKNAPTSDEMTKLDSHSSPTNRRERKTVDGSKVLASTYVGTIANAPPMHPYRPHTHTRNIHLPPNFERLNVPMKTQNPISMLPIAFL